VLRHRCARSAPRERELPGTLLWVPVKSGGVDARGTSLRCRLSRRRIRSFKLSGVTDQRSAAGLKPLTDAEFWPIIDVLGGRYQLRTIAAAERELSRRSEFEILRWAETAALKALELDSVIDFRQDTFWALGAVIGKGRKVFETVLEDADAYEPNWINDNSQSVLFIGGGAIARHGADPHVITSFTPRHSELVKELYPGAPRE